MSPPVLKEPNVLSIYFNTRGFGHALFEGVVAPVDWHVSVKTAKVDLYEKALALLTEHNPSVLVLRNCECKAARCSQAVQERIDRIAADASDKGMHVYRYSRVDIQKCFVYYGAQTKDEIAREIAKVLPEFEPLVPPMRRSWTNEHHQMGLFDALALVFTYYSAEKLRSTR